MPMSMWVYIDIAKNVLYYATISFIEEINI